VSEEKVERGGVGREEGLCLPLLTLFAHMISSWLLVQVSTVHRDETKDQS
ncbi:hypothetical protein Bpfe_005893, partial [Biomphalaria pfeifferi]